MDIDVPNVPGKLNDGGFEMTENMYVKWLNDPSLAFGHVWTLSGLLLDIDIDTIIQ